MKPVRFPLLNFPLAPLRSVADRLTQGVPTKLRKLLQEADYPVRLLRYWWAAQALRAESLRLGRPLQVVDLGCERGWLKHFTPEGVVERWIGIDWVVQPEINRLANYDEVHAASFDGRLPKEDAVADAVVSLHVFEHLPRPGWTMAEVSRMLKPGGIFLGAAPTMPDWVAKLRERYFRRRLAAGQVAVGGHITVLSPQRWRDLAYECGLNVEFATGSHFIRKTGSKLENHRWWVRVNQLWGALFPSLGSECCVQARRAAAWQEQTDRLLPEDPHWRRLWIGLGIAALAALIASPFFVAKVLEDRKLGKLTAWMDRHQTGGDVFVVHDDGIAELREKRPDCHFADTLPELLALADRHPGARLLISQTMAGQLAALDAGSQWTISSRLDVNGPDYLLLRRGPQGTALREYLSGTGGA
jgi:SAM-dependent methyltransferase